MNSATQDYPSRMPEMKDNFVINSQVIVQFPCSPAQASLRRCGLSFMQGNIDSMGNVPGAATMNTTTPRKSKIEEAIAKLPESDLLLTHAFIFLLLCLENGQIEEAVTALESIADGAG